MYTGTIKSGKGATLRPTPSTNNTAIGAYPFNAAIKGDHIDPATKTAAQEWMHIVDINGTAVNGWMATKYNGVQIVQYTGTEEPALGDIVTVDITATVNGVAYGKTGIQLNKLG